MSKQKQNFFTQILYAMGFHWASPPPKTINDPVFNRKASVSSPGGIELNGHVLNKKTLQILAGCPAGGTVTVRQQGPSRIQLIAKHPLLIKNQNFDTNFVEIRKEPKGYVLYLDYIWFSAACPKGLGVVALLRMAQTAQSLGFVKLELLAAGGTGIKGSQWAEPYWGYSTWPQFGFDCLLQPEILKLTKLVPELANCTKVSEVVAIRSDWWKVHGDGWEMTFDLLPNSDSWHTLLAYIRKKGFES